MQTSLGRVPPRAVAKKVGTLKKATTKKQGKASVKELLAQLGSAKDQGEKRRLRAELRTLGHKGGLGKGAGRPKATKKKKAKKKKAKKKAKRN